MRCIDFILIVIVVEKMKVSLKHERIDVFLNLWETFIIGFDECCDGRWMVDKKSLSNFLFSNMKHFSHMVMTRCKKESDQFSYSLKKVDKLESSPHSLQNHSSGTIFFDFRPKISQY